MTRRLSRKNFFLVIQLVLVLKAGFLYSIERFRFLVSILDHDLYLIDRKFVLRQRMELKITS